MTTCILADDEAHLLRYLQDQLKAAWPELQVRAVAINGIDAAKCIAEHAPDIAFLDIQMPGLTGLEVAQGIETATRVVFVTAYDEYAVQAFEQGAADYLLKPITRERLDKAVGRLKQSLAANEEPKLAALLKTLMSGQASAAAPVGAALGVPTAPQYLRYVRASERSKDGELTLQIPVSDVLYFDAADKYTVIMTTRGEKLARTAISELESQLDPQEFARIHRSTLVNLEHVYATRRDETSRMFVRFKNHDRELPVSRAYHDVFAKL